MALTLALAQFNATADVARNLETVREQAGRAAAAGADAVVFPEATMAAFGSDLRAAAEQWAEQWMTEVLWLAMDLGITVVVGEFVPAPENKVRNLLAVYTPESERYEYAKIHLYDAFGFHESATVAEGREPVVLNLGPHKVGLALCYDIRFPKLFAELSRRGAEAVLVAASWAPGEGKAEQWELLARARALDSNTVVVAVDQADPEVSGVPVPADSPTGVGHSLVADPFGRVLARLDGAERLEIVKLDLDVVEEARNALPVLENARLGY